MARQTAVEWYANRIGEILGDMCNQFTVEQTLANYYAIKQAKAMEREQIEEAFNEAVEEGSTWHIDGEGYFVNRYGGNNG
jgi:hypothetical protein